MAIHCQSYLFFCALQILEISSVLLIGILTKRNIFRKARTLAFGHIQSFAPLIPMKVGKPLRQGLFYEGGGTWLVLKSKKPKLNSRDCSEHVWQTYVFANEVKRKAGRTM
jgi:hypothetical protein